jgi:hypothetical protein
VSHGEAESGGSAVVEDVERIAGEAKRLGELVDGVRERVKGVLVPALAGNLREAKAGQVGGDDVIAIGQAGDEIAVLERGGGEPVEQKDDGSVDGAGFAIEDANSVGIDAVD